MRRSRRDLDSSTYSYSTLNEVTQDTTTKDKNNSARRYTAKVLDKLYMNILKYFFNELVILETENLHENRYDESNY